LIDRFKEPSYEEWLPEDERVDAERIAEGEERTSETKEERDNRRWMKAMADVSTSMVCKADLKYIVRCYGRQKGARNRATDEARAAAAAGGIMPLDHMLSVMRDCTADQKRRDAMAMAAAPYLHPKLSAIDAKLTSIAANPSPETDTFRVEFVLPSKDHARDDSP
jgi:hypothetical protein